MTTSLTQPRWLVQQTPRVPLRYATEDALRVEAATLLVEMAPSRIPDGDVRFAWSRARGGHQSNPFYRTALFFRALREMGGSLEAAWIGLAWLIGKVEAMWADVPLCVRKAHDAEIAADLDEDRMQYRVLVEPAAKKAYREKLIHQLAAGHALLAALDAEDAKGARRTA